MGVRIVKSDEESLGAKLPRRIELAQGEVVSILEDDDLFMSNKLQTVKDVFSKGEVVSIVTTFYQLTAKEEYLRHVFIKGLET